MKNNEPNWKKAYDAYPADYEKRFDATLSALKEEQVMTKKTALKTALIAAIVCLLLVGTALALGGAWGILDFFGKEYGIAPREDAISVIEKNLGSAQNELVKLTVREAVYDGSAVRALLTVEPIDSEKYAVVNDISDITEVEEGKTAEECAEEYALTTGRNILVASDVWIDVDNAGNYTGSGCISRDGEALLAYCEIDLNGEAPETVSVVANAEILDGGACAVGFELEKVPSSVKEFTCGYCAPDGFSLISASLAQTPFAAYLRVIYQSPETSYERVAQLIDTSATYYMTKFGNYAHLDPECSGMANAQPVSGSELSIYEKLPCPICAGGDSVILAGPEEWTLALTDENGRPIETAGQSGSDAPSPSAPRAYGALLILQAGSVPDGDIFATFTAPDGTVYPAIRLS